MDVQTIKELVHRLRKSGSFLNLLTTSQSKSIRNTHACLRVSFIQLLQVTPLDAPSIALLQTKMDRSSHRQYIIGLGDSVYAYPKISDFRCPAVSDSFNQVGRIREEEYVFSIIGVRIRDLVQQVCCLVMELDKPSVDWGSIQGCTHHLVYQCRENKQ